MVQFWIIKPQNSRKYRFLTPLPSDWLPAEAVVVFRRLLWTLNSLDLVVATNPSFREIRTGGASFPSNHSSASTDGSGPTVSGYRSSWNRSDCTAKGGNSQLIPTSPTVFLLRLETHLTRHRHDYGFTFPLMQFVEPGGKNIWIQ